MADPRMIGESNTCRYAVGYEKTTSTMYPEAIGGDQSAEHPGDVDTPKVMKVYEPARSYVTARLWRCAVCAAPAVGTAP